MVRPLKGIQADVGRTTANADQLIAELRVAVSTLSQQAEHLIGRIDALVKAVREEGLAVRSSIAGHKIPAEILITPKGEGE